MEKFTRSLIKFDGARNHDVVKWLQYIEEAFDRVQLQASHKYLAISYFLTSDAAIWFKHSASSIPDWFTFQGEIIKAFPSSSVPCLLYRHQLTIEAQLQTLEQEQDILRIPASSSTMSHETLDTDNTSFDSINDNRINSVDDLESKNLCESEQGHCLPMLVHVIDPDLKIQPQCAAVVDNCDELRQQGASMENDSDKLEPQDAHVGDDYDHLEQRGESDIDPDSVKNGIEDTFENFTQTMDSLFLSDSLTDTVLPQNIQYFSYVKCKSRQPRILNQAHIVYSWNKYNKRYYHFTILQFYVKPYCDTIGLNVLGEEWADSYNHVFHYYCHNQKVRLRFSPRKWKYRRSTLFPFRKWKFRPLTSFFFCFFIIKLYSYSFLAFNHVRYSFIAFFR